MIHPVGDTVIRMDNVDPGTLYTGTTWQKISEGRMLIGANSTYALGSTGGIATHTHTNPTTGGSSAANTGGTTLTAAQSGVPAHSHGMTHTHNIGTDALQPFYFYAGSDKILRRTIKNGTGTSFTDNLYAETTNHVLERWSTTAYPNTTKTGDNTAANASQAHSHTMAHTHTQGDTGSASNIPPYLAVNIWIRTA